MYATLAMHLCIRFMCANVSMWRSHKTATERCARFVIVQPVSHVVWYVFSPTQFISHSGFKFHFVYFSYVLFLFLCLHFKLSSSEFFNYFSLASIWYITFIKQYTVATRCIYRGFSLCKSWSWRIWIQEKQKNKTIRFARVVVRLDIRFFHR